MKLADPWAARLRTARAAALLCLARALIALVPFRVWRKRLGGANWSEKSADPIEVHQLAAHVARAAWRLPFAVRCLPQAMALSWQLRRRGLAHTVVFAARPIVTLAILIGPVIELPALLVLTKVMLQLRTRWTWPSPAR